MLLVGVGAAPVGIWPKALEELPPNSTMWGNCGGMVFAACGTTCWLEEEDLLHKLP